MAAPEPTPDVRTRVLEAAWRLIGERGDASVSLLEIAAASGVSRQTLYVNFGNRAGLLLAMVAHRDASSPELARMKRAIAETPEEDVVEAMVRAWFKYVPIVYSVSHALQAAAATDEDARKAWESRMALLHGGIQAMLQRVKAKGLLAPGWTAAAAADWLHHLVHVDTWHHLVVERNWRPADVVQRTVATVHATLIRKPADPR
jgi:AcrR family transcriptional regulator